MLLIALAVRIWGIDWQLPAALYYDEMKYVAWAHVAKDDPSAQVTDLRNPTFFHHLLRVEYAVASALRRGGSTQETAVFELWLARVTSAVLGALACLLTALAAGSLAGAVAGRGRPAEVQDEGRRVDQGWAGLAAGLVLALAPLHVHLSHVAVNDAPASLFLAASLLFGSRALAGGSRRDLLLAGLGAGLAFSTKYSFAIGLMLPLMAAVLARPPCNRQDDGQVAAAGGAPNRPAPRRALASSELTRRVMLILVVVVGFVFGAAVGGPEIVSRPGAVVAGALEQARLGSRRWNGQADSPVWMLYGETLIQGLGWPALLVAGIGAVALGWRDRTALAAVLAVPLVCLVVMLRQELFFARFALPLLPSLAMLAGIGVMALLRRGASGAWARTVGRTRAKVVLFVAVLAAILLPETLVTVRHNQLATTTDTRVLAQRWLRQRGDGARAATELYGQPITWAGAETARGFRLQRVSSFVDASTVTRLACEGTRYFLTASLTTERELARRGSRTRESGYDVLAREGRVVRTFDPFQPGLSAPAHPDNTGIPFWYLEAYARPGPKITVFELPAGAVACAR